MWEKTSMIDRDKRADGKSHTFVGLAGKNGQKVCFLKRNCLMERVFSYCFWVIVQSYMLIGAIQSYQG